MYLSMFVILGFFIYFVWQLGLRQMLCVLYSEVVDLCRFDAGHVLLILHL